ncbi:hypothetical protein M5K25_008628 [Dendrobium thyrsiflorum]|uniref:Uncharacterized protein n=1 Tax=Dendrobium thyrsiflorum TaxID=117978 RepID=A0ABD0V9T5_DENTH
MLNDCDVKPGIELKQLIIRLLKHAKIISSMVHQNNFQEIYVVNGDEKVEDWKEWFATKIRNAEGR